VDGYSVTSSERLLEVAMDNRGVHWRGDKCSHGLLHSATEEVTRLDSARFVSMRVFHCFRCLLKNVSVLSQASFAASGL